MGIEVSWHSKQGQRTDDNRDYCGVGLRDDDALCIVLDGSTSGANSGEFARLIARDLIDWFMAAGKVNPDAIIDRLSYIHTNLTPRFRKGSASYVVALIGYEGTVRLLYAGDCLAGLRKGVSAIEWRVRPHTLANAITDMPITKIASSPLRNRLTRSFRAREFMTPDDEELALRGDNALVLATDGFRAALDMESQARVLAA
ncbi:MAG: PP2C family protein-serine/threonine phosphatase [Sphingomonadales bacterium]